MVYKLSDLLPYTSDTLLNSLSDRMRVLQLLRFFCYSIEQGVQAFLSHHYEAFDAQVSENLCQIRAYKLIQIIDENDDNQTIELGIISCKIREIYKKVESLLDEYAILSKKRPSHYSKMIDQNLVLAQFLNHHEIDLEFSNLIYFLGQTYILSKHKLVGEYDISHGINYDTLCQELDISSKTYARKVVHRLQRNVSKHSCQFIFTLLFHINANAPQLHLLKSLHFQDEVGRFVLACYEVTKIILQHAFQNNKYIRVIVNRIAKEENDRFDFVLKPSQTPQCYQVVTSDKSISDGVLTCVGVTHCQILSESKEEYIARFQEVGFEDVILSNMAQHPQYAGLLLHDKKYNPYLNLRAGLQPSYADYIGESERQFLRHKAISSHIGCAVDNSSLFLLTHVRCSNVPAQPLQVGVKPEELEAAL